MLLGVSDVVAHSRVRPPPPGCPRAGVPRSTLSIDRFNHRRLDGEIGSSHPPSTRTTTTATNRPRHPSERQFRASTERDAGQSREAWHRAASRLPHVKLRCNQLTRHGLPIPSAQPSPQSARDKAMHAACGVSAGKGRQDRLRRLLFSAMTLGARMEFRTRRRQISTQNRESESCRRASAPSVLPSTDAGAFSSAGSGQDRIRLHLLHARPQRSPTADAIPIPRRWPVG